MLEHVGNGEGYVCGNGTVMTRESKSLRDIDVPKKLESWILGYGVKLMYTILEEEQKFLSVFPLVVKLNINALGLQDDPEQYHI
jgi:hypothetical protein